MWRYTLWEGNRTIFTNTFLFSCCWCCASFLLISIAWDIFRWYEMVFQSLALFPFLFWCFVQNSFHIRLGIWFRYIIGKRNLLERVRFSKYTFALQVHFYKIEVLRMYDMIFVWMWIFSVGFKEQRAQKEYYFEEICIYFSFFLWEHFWNYSKFHYRDFSPFLENHINDINVIP